jgi:nicotinamidase-related amidase
MTPYVGAPVVVNVASQHNGGSPHAAALVTAVDGDRVNVRVLYDSPPHLLPRHAPEHLTDVAFHSGVTPEEGNKGGLFGAFWPAGSLELQIQLLTDQQEFLMTELSGIQSDIDAATAALNNAAEVLGTAATTITGVATDMGTQTTAVQAALAAFQAANPGADTTALDTAVSGLSTPLDALQAAATALQSADTALDSAVTSASTAAGSATTTGTSTTEPASPAPVTGGDTGAAS